MMLQRTASIIEHVPLAEKTYRIRLHCPEIAAAIVPGQFLMLRVPGTNDPLLGRPFAMYDIIDGVAIDVVYLVIGKMTTLMAGMSAGENLEIWGPLGNGFIDFGPRDEVTFVAGGIGQTPFLAYARELLGTARYGSRPGQAKAKKVNLFYGARSQNYLAGLDDFRTAGVNLHLATDDGSAGYKGFVTQLLAEQAPPGPWVGCGPEPMLHALQTLATKLGRDCYVSLETPMACGFGICFSCVTKVKVPGGFDYRRVCVEGPVFNACDLDWSH